MCASVRSYVESDRRRRSGAVGIGLCVSPSGPPRAGAFHAGPEIKAGMPVLAAATDATADGAPPPPAQ